MNVLLFAGSLRKDSLNKQLLGVASRYLKSKTDLNIEIVDLKSLSLPVYDADIEAEGFPQGVQDLIAAVEKAQAVVISSPEYNGSISSPLKNAVDWVSRQKPQHPWVKKPILLFAASPGALGGMRSLMHTPQTFLVLGAYLYPQVFSLPRADKELVNQDLQDTKMKQRLEKTLDEFLVYAQKLTEN